MTQRLVVAFLFTLLAVPSDPFAKRLKGENEILHALNRLTWGPRAGDVDALRRTGVHRWIEEQLHPERIPESSELTSRLEPLESLRMSNEEIVRNYPPRQMILAYAQGRLPMPSDPQKRALVERLSIGYRNRLEKKGVEAPDVSTLNEVSTPDQSRTLRGARREMFERAAPENRRKMLAAVAPQQVLAHDLQEAKFYRAIYTNRQLEDVLSDFWFNHFNVYLEKGADRFLTTSYERDAIRPHVLGRFRNLLQATAEHPAMLWYLDNWQSVSPDSRQPGRRGGKRSRGLNENYARELLELHTLGVDGGYTQKDIIDVARCFTGWTIREPYRGAEFAFNDRVHDRGEKVVLGVKIPAGGGKEDGLKVLDVIARHPSTARFISRKLAQRFVADRPPEELVVSMAKTFAKSDGDLRAVLTTMFKSREFWSEGAYQSKIKSPFEMVVSSIRAAGADVSFAFGLATKLADLGQPLYRKQEPTGYSSTSEDWVNSAALLGRMNFAIALANNELPGVRLRPDRWPTDPVALEQSILFTEASSQTKAAVERGLAEMKGPAVIAGLVLGSPDFQRR